MKLIIDKASACIQKNASALKLYTDDPSWMLITCESEGILELLVHEFGVHSKNFRHKNQYEYPKTYAASTGTGKFPTYSHVCPFRIDSDNQFTITNGVRTGGMFVNTTDLSIIKSFLAAHAPELTIEDRTSIVNWSDIDLTTTTKP
jgi:hypothetical protein